MPQSVPSGERAEPGRRDRLGVDVVVQNRPGEHGVLGNRALIDAEILRDVAAGEYTAGLVTLTPELLTAIEAGQLRPLASGSHERPAYLPDVPTFYEVIGPRSPDPASEPDYTIDTAFSAPEFIGEAKAATLSSTLSRCLSTDNVQRDIGAEFIMPADQGEPWEQGERYRKLAHAVQLQLNMAEIEGR